MSKTNSDKIDDFVFGWYNRSTGWVQVLLFPFLLVFCVIYTVVLTPFAVIILIWVLVLSVKGRWEYHRYWRKLNERGQVISWPEVESKILGRKGTLVVVLDPNGFGCSWWVDKSVNEIDPDHVVPSWREFEEQARKIFDTSDAIENLNRWANEQWPFLVCSGRALVPSKSQLAELPIDAKQHSVLAVPWIISRPGSFDTPAEPLE